MSKDKELELMLETYHDLIIDDEQIAARIGRQVCKWDKLQKQQEKIHGDMAEVEERIRELLGSPDADEPECPPETRGGAGERKWN